SRPDPHLGHGARRRHAFGHRGGDLAPEAPGAARGAAAGGRDTAAQDGERGVVESDACARLAAMKTLILMRHAKSAWNDPQQKDIDRPLNGRGRKSAPRMGAWL